MRILALDLSLTATGWAHHGWDYGAETGPGKLRGVERLAAWYEWLDHMIEDVRPDVAVIEGYAMGARGRAIFGVGEWGGVARLRLHLDGILIVEVAPATIKKYATGRGNATKPDMRMELFKRTGFDIPDDNTVDAVWLYLLARQASGDPVYTMPAVNVAAVDKVDWPT